MAGLFVWAVPAGELADSLPEIWKLLIRIPEDQQNAQFIKQDDTIFVANRKPVKFWYIWPPLCPGRQGGEVHYYKSESNLLVFSKKFLWNFVDT